jgi:hypothetical protein
VKWFSLLSYTGFMISAFGASYQAEDT